MKLNTIIPERILEYVDVPQLFLARDKFDTRYICLLYEDEPSLQYTAVRISSEQLMKFCQQQIDLRTLFVHPEYEGEYYNVVKVGDEYNIQLLEEKKLSEDRLPEEGYYLDNSENENITILLPKQEKNLFLDLIRRHGWVAI